MSYKLLIVESPKKAKTIAKILGDGWRVGASYGHVRDLPEKELGIDLVTFNPKYVVPDRAKPNLDKLKALASQADDVFLATDLDREGEAIAYHLGLVLRLNNPKRVGFTEITAQAINRALASPRAIDTKMVMAQESRRVADRIVGYEVSPVLCKQANQGLSAGRVQTPALRLVVDVENTIRNFVSRDYHDVFITLDSDLQLKHNPKNCSPDGKHLYDKALAEAISKTKRVCITNVEVKKREIKPKSPLTTSLLQQAANSSLKLQAAKTMEFAQHLFESGHISYHRTDNPNMSVEGFNDACAWLLSNGLTPNATQHKWASKANAQEAHEAIRPTDFSKITVDASPEIQAVYALIHERAAASCMPSAIDEVTTIESVSEDHISYENEKIKANFKATATLEVSKGWRQLMVLDKEDDLKEEEGGRITSLPRVGDLHSVKSSKIDSKVTLPPPRYTEGSLIKKLESLGIGRPSTYASILQNIIGKAYIQVGSPDGEKTKSKNALFPTSLGIAIIDALQSQQFIDYDFTSKMEDSLDEIANGKDTYARVVSELYKTVTEGLPRIKLDTSMIPKRFLELPCPKCEKTVRRVQKKDDKSFFFWVHVDEGQGDVCEPYLLDVKEKPVTKESLEQPCPKCEKPVKRVQKKDKSGWFWVHVEESNAEGCEPYLLDVKEKPVTKESLEQPCPKCDKPVKRVQKKDDKSFFFWVHVDEGQGAVCEPYLLDVKEKPVTKESLEQPCPKCEKPVKRVQKKDKSGWFWVHVEESNAEGCERFLPDLKGKPTTNELLEQPCPFCKNPIKRLKSKEKKEFFWVHTSQPISGGCSMYLSDTKGKPTKQTTGVKS